MRDVLHICWSLRPGGTERWLLNVLKTSAELRERTHVCAVEPTRDGGHGVDLEADLRDLGVPVWRDSFSYLAYPTVRRLRRLIRSLGVSVVHSHLDGLSGLVTAAAHLEGVPVRVAHYHSEPLGGPPRRIAVRAFLGMSRMVEARSATHIVACSHGVLRRCFHTSLTPARNLVVYCGVPIDRFIGNPQGPGLTRAAFGIPEASLVIGHVGNFLPGKNHIHILQVFREILKQCPQAYLLLVGDGPLRGTISQMSAALGIGARTSILGVRDDVPEVLAGCVDVFLFPSLHEGLPLSCLEAQAAGVPVIMGTNMTAEAVVVTELVQRLPLSAGPSTWANECIRMAQSPRLTATCLRSKFEESQHTIDCAAHSLLDIYADYDISNR